MRLPFVAPHSGWPLVLVEKNGSLLRCSQIDSIADSFPSSAWCCFVRGMSSLVDGVVRGLLESPRKMELNERISSMALCAAETGLRVALPV